MNPEIEISALLERAEKEEEKARNERGNTARNLFGRAVDAYFKAVGLAEDHWGQFDENTLTIRDRLASALRENGNLVRAISVNKENVSRYQDCQGDPHYLTLQAKRRLAECYLANKNHADAIKTYSNILLSRGQVSDIDLYQDRTDLAAALFQSGTTANIMEAINFNIKTLDMVGKKLGEDHIEAIKVRHNLGAELSKLRKYEDAVKHFDKNLRLLRDPICNARIDDSYRQYVSKSEASLATCSKILKRKEQTRIENERLEKERREKERAEKLEKERLETIARERAETLAKEKAESERVKREEARKQRRLKAQERAEQERIEKERIEKERIERERIERERIEKERIEMAIREVIRLQNERLEQEKLEAARVEKEKEKAELEAKARSEERRRKRREEKSRLEKERITEEQSAKHHKELGQPQRQTSKRVSQDKKVGEPSKQKDSTRQEERQKSHRLQSPEETRLEVYEDKSKAVKKNQEQRRGQDNVHLDPGSSQLQDVGKTPGPKKTSATPKSRSFEELPVLDHDNHDNKKTDKKSVHSRSRSTSGRPASTPPSIPDIVLHQNPRPSASIKDRDKKKLDDGKADNANGATKKRHSRNNGSASDIDISSEKTGASIEGRKKTRHSSSPSNHHSTPELVYPGGEPALAGASPGRRHSKTKSETNSIVGSQPSEDMVNTAETSVVPSRSKDRDRQPVVPTVQQDSVEITDEGQVKLDVPSISIPAKSPPLSSPTLLGQSWMQGLKTITGYTTKAVEVLSSRRGSLPERLEHENSPGHHVKTTPAQKEIPEKIQDSSNTGGLPEATAAPVHSARAVKNRASIIPGSWDQEFDEPRSEKGPAEGYSSNNFQDNAAMQSPSLRIPDIVPTSPVEARSNRRRSREFRWDTTFSDVDMQKADEWIADLKEDAHALLDKYKNDSHTSKANRPIKIAILDTGVARSAAKGPALMKTPRVKLGKQLDKSLPWNDDVDGHGTHAAGLILQVCPYADVYVYRVLESHESLSVKPLSRAYVTEALYDAVDKKKVDIVSMSLGWKEDNDKDLRDAINHAKRNDVLLFAASSNDGVRGGMAYPARADEVIAIDAADGYGRSSRFNPPQDTDKTRFTVLGEAVRSTYPKNLGSDEPGWKRMSGTSCATPIAAGIAGLVLEFARQRPICLDFDPDAPVGSSIEAHLKKVEGMRQVFKQLLSIQVEGFYHLHPKKLFECDEQFEDGGEWFRIWAPRMSAAQKIVKCLRDRFSPYLGLQMIAAIEEENRRGGQAA